MAKGRLSLFADIKQDGSVGIISFAEFLRLVAEL